MPRKTEMKKRQKKRRRKEITPVAYFDLKLFESLTQFYAKTAEKFQ